MNDAPSIRFDAPAAGRAGGVVHGAVVVTRPPPEACRELVVRLSRGACSRKRPARDSWETVAQVVLVEGRRLADGERLEVALEVPIGSPPSYEGKLVQLVWRLEVSAHFGGMKAPIVERRPIRIDPAPVEGVLAPSPPAPRDGGYRASGVGVQWEPLFRVEDPAQGAGTLARMAPEARAALVDLVQAARWYHARRPTGSALAWVMVAILGVIAVGMILLGTLAGLLALFNEPAKGAGFLLFFGLAGLGAGTIARDWLRQTAIPRWRDRGVSLDLIEPPRLAALGERPTLTLHVTTRGQAVKGLRYELVTVEECAYTKSVHRRDGHHESTAWDTRETIVDSGNVTIRSEHAASPTGTTGELTVTLPHDRPSTVVSADRVVRWEVRVHLETGIERTVIAPLVVAPLTAQPR